MIADDKITRLWTMLSTQFNVTVYGIGTGQLVNNQECVEYKLGLTPRAF